MSYTVTKLISEAFYTSGIVSRDFQTVSGAQEAVGLTKLNEILSDTQIEDEKIPYFNTAYNFNAVAGQEMYFIPNLVEAETLTFFIQTIRYQMDKTNKDKYFGQGRAQNVLSLPFTWNCERTVGGSNIFMYFLPVQPFPMQLTGLFKLQNVTLYQDLSTTLTIANLGQAVVNGTGTFGVGQLVVNGVDLAGTYPKLPNVPDGTSLMLFINMSGIIPGVTAGINGQEFFLQATRNTNINITTLGTEGTVNNVTFANFSTINGPQNANFMAQGLDQYYINYLQYALADRLCTAYNFIVPPGVEKQLLKYDQSISSRSAPMDLTLQKISTLDNAGSINYAQVNLGRGWTV